MHNYGNKLLYLTHAQWKTYFICLTKVLFPDSPAPVQEERNPSRLRYAHQHTTSCSQCSHTGVQPNWHTMQGNRWADIVWFACTLYSHPWCVHPTLPLLLLIPPTSHCKDLHSLSPSLCLTCTHRHKQKEGQRRTQHTQIPKICDCFQSAVRHCNTSISQVTDQLEYMAPETLFTCSTLFLSLTCALIDFQCCILQPIQSNFEENI